MHFKIPKKVTVYYSKIKNCIVIKILKKNKKLILPSSFYLVFIKQKIFILTKHAKKIPNAKIKNLMFLKKIIFSFFKIILTEIQGNFYKKLILKGIGYKVFDTNYSNILLFKLGYTHSIYFKLNLNFFIYKNYKLFLSDNIYQNLLNTSFLIKLLKWPEPYKGKGIYFFNDKIKLKTTKKI